MATTTERGYGSAHERARKAAIAAFVPGQPCTRCHEPLPDADDVELDHDDRYPKSAAVYLGLAHSLCNRSAGGRKGAAIARAKKMTVARDW